VLVEEFRADSAAVRLFTRPRSPADAGLAEFVGPGSEARRHFETVLEAGRAPVCGRLKPAQLQFLFADQAAEIGSGALVPLGEPARYGVIAIGSRDARRFHPAMGTMFLRHMGEIVTRILDPHVDPNVSAA